MKGKNLSDCKGSAFVKIFIAITVIGIYVLSFSGAKEHHDKATAAKISLMLWWLNIELPNLYGELSSNQS